MRDSIDYMHIAKFNGRWVMINVLWELKSKKKKRKIGNDTNKSANRRKCKSRFG
jgi:hypothetical protein